MTSPNHTKSTVKFYFDYSSPYAYLGSTQIERVAKENGGTVEVVPFLLGALFNSIGAPMVPFLAVNQARQNQLRLDLVRYANHWNVPFFFNNTFPLNTVKALRLTLLTEGTQQQALIAALMKAAWADNKNIGEDTVLSEILESVGLPSSLIARTQEQSVKDKLKANTDEAIRIGCPGAPCFLVGDQLFWGQDRLEFVGKALKGWKVG